MGRAFTRLRRPAAALCSAHGHPLDPPNFARLSRRVVELRLEHRDLDGAIERLAADIQADELALKRLKKRKLQLKDQIAWLENALIPDEPESLAGVGGRGAPRVQPSPDAATAGGSAAAPAVRRWCGCCPG